MPATVPNWPSLPKKEWAASDERLLRLFLKAGRKVRRSVNRKTASTKPKHTDGKCGFDSRYGMAKFLAYRLIVAFVIRGRDSVIKAEVDRLRNERKISFGRGPSFEDNKFYWGLLLIFPDHDVALLDRHARRRIANELLYAFKREIPPAFLLGFLYQIRDGEPILRKLHRDKWEPWLRPRLLAKFPPLP